MNNMSEKSNDKTAPKINAEDLCTSCRAKIVEKINDSNESSYSYDKTPIIESKHDKKLYFVNTKGCGSYYVVARDPKEASNAVEQMLNDQDYGFSKNRKVVTILLHAEEFRTALHDKTKPFLSGDENLLLADEWNLTNKK